MLPNTAGSLSFDTFVCWPWACVGAMHVGLGKVGPKHVGAEHGSPQYADLRHIGLELPFEEVDPEACRQP
jgi:hypothetical protein